MDIEYDLNLDDIKEWNLFYMDYSPLFKRQRKRGRIFNIVLMSVSFLAAIVFWIIGGLRVLPGTIILGLVGIYSLVWHFVAPSHRRKRVNKAVEKSYGNGVNSDVGRHKFSITQDKMIDITDMGESSQRWDVVEQVITTQQHLLILLRGAKAHIIPRRAFPDEESFTKFAEQAKSYQQKAPKQSII